MLKVKAQAVMMRLMHVRDNIKVTAGVPNHASMSRLTVSAYMDLLSVQLETLNLLDDVITEVEELRAGHPRS